MNIFNLVGIRAAPTVAPSFSDGVAEFLDVASNKVTVSVGVVDAGVEATGVGATAGVHVEADVGSIDLLILSIMVSGGLDHSSCSDIVSSR